MPARATVPLLSLVCVAALGLRVHYVSQVEIPNAIRADAREYVAYAYNLVHRGTFSREIDAAPRPDSFRSPGYPLLVAAISLAVGEARLEAAVRGVQALLGAALVPLTFAVGRRFLPAAAALVAAGLVALSPHLVSMTGYLLTETLFAFLLLASLACLYRALARRSSAAFAGAGALFGAAQLTNETALLLPPLLAGLSLWLARCSGAPRGRGLLVMTAVFLAFPAAWALRNAASVPPGTRGGVHRVLATMTHGAYPGWVHRDPRFRYYAYREDPESARMGDSIGGFASVMWERVRARPARYARWYLLEKPAALWSWSILQGQGDIYVYPVARSPYETAAVPHASRALMRELHPALVVIAALGIPFCLVAWRGRPGEWWLSSTPLLLLATGAYFTLIYTVSAPWPRYAIPLRPALYLWSTWIATGMGRVLLGRAAA